MSRLRPIDRCLRWATMLALVLATLAPGVSHALRHLRGDTMPWSLLCSATGAKRLVFEAPTGDDGSIARTHAFEQCTYCALHHDSPASAAAPATPAVRTDLAHELPTPVLQAPRPQTAWRFALSRAPPPRA